MKRGSGLAGVVSTVLLAVAARAQQFDVKLTLAYSVFVVGEPVVVQVDLLNATRDQVDVGAPGSTSVLLVEIFRGGAMSCPRTARIRLSRRSR